MGKVFFDDPVHHISGKISKKQMKIRQRFKVVRLAALNRSMDLSHLTYDQIDYVEERRNGRIGKISYKGWLFRKAWKCFSESTNTVNMPDRLNTIA